jgi:xanthine/uracil permease
MRSRVIGMNVALMVVFGTLGLTQFSENVRAVQILGLFSSGAVVGSSLVIIISALRARRQSE